MDLPETKLLDQLERTRKMYQTALIDLRLAEEAALGLQNSDSTRQMGSARSQFSQATSEYQEALKAFTDFALGEAGKRVRDLGSD